MQIHVENARKRAKKTIFATEIDFDSLWNESEGMSWAELAEVVRMSVEGKFFAMSTGEDYKEIDTEYILEKLKKFKTQNGNKNQIFRDLWINGLQETLKKDTSGAIADALRTEIIRRVGTELVWKIESGAVGLPNLLEVLKNPNKNKKKMGW